jgi:glycerophosphoryl diester phosphodiesterase
MTTGILLVSRLVDLRHAFSSAKATDVWQHADYIDSDLIAEAHGEGARVIAWTVNEVSRASELKAIGVDGICTDTPRELLERLTDSAS